MSHPHDDLRAAMRHLLDAELVARAGAQLAATAPLGSAPAVPADVMAPDLLERDVLQLTAAALRLPEDQIDPRENLATYGIDSIAITEVMTRISRHFGVSIAPTTFFEARHLADLVAILRARHGAAIAAHYARVPAAPEAPAPEAPAPAKATSPDVAGWLARHRAARGRSVPIVVATEAPPAAIAPLSARAAGAGTPAPLAHTTRTNDGAGDIPVAIIAMEGMFPQSPDLDAFEAHLRAGDDCIAPVPPERWDWRAVDGDPKAGPYTHVHTGGFIAGHDAFDAAFFGISPKEAELMDPQHRLFMECVWRLIEGAGHAPGSLSGRKVGLFLGINLQDYADLANRAGLMDAVQLTGLGHVFCPNRLSFLLDIHGPSQVIDTACSSSLVALHRAVMSIRYEGCEMAIAGGANLMLTPTQHILFSRVGMLSRDGRCKTFSRDADGYGRADGIGAVLLKRLDHAERDGDQILGLIRASAENHGGGASSLTAPNPKAQARLIVDAFRQGGIDPRTVTLMECHGTGTPLGDPVEVEGLKTAFADLYAQAGLPAPEAPFCGLGSVKSNIGHAETAAGIAGVLKVLLALRAGTLYRSLHCADPNPLIALDGTPFYLLDQARPWARPVVDGAEAPRRAGVSSFGAGGANAHVVIEEYRDLRPRPAAPAGPFVVPLSAKTPAALFAGVSRLAAHLVAGEGALMADLAFTLQTGRDALRVRAAFVARDLADLLAQLRAVADGGVDAAPFETVDRKAAAGMAPVDPSAEAPEQVAARWRAGAPVAWARLYEGRASRRVRLPTYAFQRKRFWLPPAAGSPTRPVGAPAEAAMVLREVAPGRFRMELDPAVFYLRDHQVDGTSVLPGVAYLELMRLTAARAGLDGHLGQIVWLKRLTVTAPASIEIAVIQDGALPARIELSRLDADGAPQLHAQARLVPGAVPAPAPVDLAALEAAHPHRHTASGIYAAFAALGIGYGPAHRAITGLATGTDSEGHRQVFARLALPEAMAGSTAHFALHPSLMDGAFQAAIGVTLDADGGTREPTALPFALDALEVFGPCVPQMVVHIRASEGAGTGARVRRLDLDLMDMAGAVRVRLRGFATRVAAQEGMARAGAGPATDAADAPALLFAPAWLPLAAAAPAVAPAVFSAHAALLCGLDDLPPEALAAHLVGWTCRASNGTGELAAGTGQPDPFLSHAVAVLAQVQDLAARAAAATPALLHIIVPAGQPTLAGLSGLLRTAQMEAAGLVCQLVEVPPDIDPAELAARLAALAGQPQAAHVRLEADGVVRSGWRALPEQPAPMPWRGGGVYLITGGAGGIGRHLAREIVATAAGVRLILAGRAPEDEAMAGLLAELDGRNGAEVRYRSLDLADAGAVEALVADIRARHGRLSGVLHAAGVTADGALMSKTAAGLAQVCAPKVAGTRNLDRALGAGPLDLFVLFASLSGALGNPGQADYAAANGFLDGFANEREARRLQGACQGRTVAIDWPLWQDGGMRMDGDAQRLMARTTGFAPLATDAAVTALYGALACDAPQVLVASGDRARIERLLLAIEHLPLGVPSAGTPEVDPQVLRHKTLAALMGLVSAQLKVALEDLAPDIELAEYGFDSISFTQFANALNDRFDLAVTPTVFFEYPTLGGLADHFASAHGGRFAQRLGVVAAPAAPVTAAPPAPVRPAVRVARSEEAPARGAVAIIGMSGIFPGAADADALWANLVAERDCIREIPPERWDWRAVQQAAPGTVSWGGFMDGIAAFDAGFFGLSAPEARMMDPQQRLLLTQAWRVMEDAGYAPRSLSGAPIGVFVGIADTGYGRLAAQAGAGVEGYAMTGLAPSVGPNRISFHFNFTGPSVAVETACSSALVAIHRAVEAIQSGDCAAALAGGVNTLLMPDSYVGFTKAGMLAPDGRSKPFSAAANGYGRGEGVGLVFLKPLAQAEADGDRILAVIRASAENHGGRAGSLTAPNPKAQAALLRTAYARAGFDPRTVTYIETHGTGTPLGDPIEVEALVAAFADLAADAEVRFGDAPPMECGIGSVKSNIGHLELAAGIAGTFKVLQQMRHGMLAKSLHSETLNPYLKLNGGPFRVVRETAPWLRLRDTDGQELPRRAGVSGFGFGGSNAHLVLEEYLAPEPVTGAAPDGPALIVLSARTEDQLRDMARDLAVAVPALPETVTLTDIAFTLQTTRDAMEHRLALTCTRRADLAAHLAAFAAGTPDDALRTGRVKANRDTLALLDSDADVRRALAGLPGRGRQDLLLDLWVRGFAFDWRALYPAGPPRKVRLPGYPFARTEYWVGLPGGTPTFAQASPVLPVVPAADVRAGSSDAVAGMLARLTAIAAAVLETGAAVLDADTELGEFGFDSITMTGFATRVNAALGLALTPADFFEFATLDRLARHVVQTVAAQTVAEQMPASPPAAARDTRIPAAPAGDPVAIVGLSCLFPGARDARAFWDNLAAGRDAITEIPPDRWDWRAFDGDPKTESGRTNVRWGGFADGIFDFDPLFFGISPREARLMDPQQRLILTHAWQALEDAGHDPRSLAGRRVGLFVGTASSGFGELMDADIGGDGYVATGAVASVGPNRASFVLDWHGPSEPVETACSSALVAIHRAVQAIAAGDCEMAVAGGVNSIVTPEAHINFAKAGMLSPDGRCKTFSASANGYVRGEGAGLLVLKPLSAAEREGDAIYGLIRGSAVNHGGRANSLTAPNTAAQADLLVQAYGRAGVDVASVGYIEAHGTGTALGDPVEINALKSAFAILRGAGAGESPAPWCGLGSVKTNIGHLELAAGAAGVIKVLLQLAHRTLAPSLNSQPPSPYMDLRGSPFFVVDAARPWPAPRDGSGAELPRRAGVSSFGFGGVNAHVILEDYVDRRPPPMAAPGPVLVPLSARAPEQLAAQAGQLADWIDAGHGAAADLADLAFTLQVGRTPLAHRLAVVVETLAELRAGLEGPRAGDFSGVAHGKADAKASGPMLPGAPTLEALAAHWVAGGRGDWTVVSGAGRRRLHLPTYPFSREVYGPDRLPEPRAQGASAGAALPGGDGPFAVSLGADDFYLRDHRIGGAGVLPGAMVLELARAAAAHGGQGPLSLSQVVWLKPVVVGAGRLMASVALDGPLGQPDVFRLTTAGGDVPILHAQGRIEAGLPEPGPALDVAGIAARCPRPLSAAWLYDTFAALGLAYGPAFRPVVELHAGAGEALGRLLLPAAVAATAGDFGLHPSLLDGAFQCCLALFQGGAEPVTAVPFALDRLDVLGPTPGEMWVHVRERPGAGPVRRLDLDLADADGRVCVRMRGFSVRALPGSGGGMRPTGRATPVAALPSAAPGQGVSPAQCLPLAAAVTAHLARLVAQETGIALERIEGDAALEAYGIDSVLITRLTDRLEADLGPLSKTLFFEYPTLDALAAYLAPAHAARWESLLAGAGGAGQRVSVECTPVEAPPGARSLAAARAPTIGSAPVTAPRGAAGQPIAIVGLAGHYPGARTLGDFWDNLASGRDSITEVPAARWDHARFYDPARGVPGKTNSKWGGFLDDFDRFDPLFFNISPREAPYMDPQERLFLQCAWETLEDAGYTRAGLARQTGSAPFAGANVGVFVGVMYEDYQLHGAERTLAGQPLALGGSPASIANRVSYCLDLHGPSLAVDSMCSSSLTAIQLACDAIHAGHCDAALAGGVNLTLHPNKYLGLAQGRFLSSSGRCESFGRGGDGYVPGEGVGAVLLKPLDRAVADGDQIHGIIRAAVLNHGGKTNGYTVPNPHAQADVITRAMARAGVAPEQVSYVEAHGTGTTLGDPIEIAALTAAYRTGTQKRGFCAIGSVKSNIGHCESAAGMAGLTKVLLQMKHGQLAPSLHAEMLNPGIDFAASPFTVQRRLATWGRAGGGQGETPRIAGLSSFGAGGSNAHLIIEEYPVPAPAAPLMGPTLFPFSARAPAALERVLRRFVVALDGLRETDLGAAAAVLQEGREAFEVRLAVIASDRAWLVSALRDALAGTNNPAVHRGTRRAGFDAGPLAARMVARDLPGLAALWVEGAALDWQRLRGDVPCRKISLPTYPFAQDRYWVPGSEPEDGGAVSLADAPAADAGQGPVAALSGVGAARPMAARVSGGDVQAVISPALAMPLLFTPAWDSQPAVPVHAPPAMTRILLCGFADAVERGLAVACAPLEVRSIGGTAAMGAAGFAVAATRLLETVQALVKDRPQSGLMQVVIPAGAQARVLEGLGGLLRSAQQEQPHIRCQLVALDAVRPDATALLAADRLSADADIRHGAAGRQVRRWRERSAQRVVQPWKDGGVYLITGGAGGLGRLLCAEIARSAARPVLWLTGRSALSPEAAEGLGGLDATIVHRRLDVTDAVAVAALVGDIRAAHGRLDGVVHAAGLTRDTLLVRKSAAAFNAVLAPKVAGLAALDAATAGCDLDVMLLFASVSGALGNAGQADYAAANAYMDAFAEARNRLVAQGARQGLTLSIDWPYWRDGGMALGADVLAAMARGFGAVPLETAPAMAALRAAVALARADGTSQVLVLDGDHDRLRANMGVAVAPRAAAMPPVTGAGLNADLDNADLDAVAAFAGAVLARELKVPPEMLEATAPFDRYGLDSVSAMEVIAALEQDLGPLSRTLLFEYPTLAKLSAALLESHGPALAQRLAAAHPLPVTRTPMVPTPEETRHPASGPAVTDIAVIAVAGRYPGADTVEEFWEALKAGRDLITQVPAARWDHAAIFAPQKGRLGKTACGWGGFLSDVDRFDAGFFGISPREADRLDPQERLLLETVWHLLERAGHTRETLQTRYEARVGVFMGAMSQQYHAIDAAPDDKALVSLSGFAALANRLSFFFDLQGPSVALDTMCSSGLEAVHLACQSLRRGECRLAIAGGVNLSIHPDKYLGLSRAGLLGSTADSRAFADGDGYLPAEGVGAVLLKPLADALRDGDAVIGVIKASAANHGGHSAGYGVPSAEAQARLIAENFRDAGIDPRTVGYVEAAASGAAFGDAIEVRAMTRAFRAFTADAGFCVLGSVKANMGHAEAASGLAQLTKCLLQLQHRQLAPTPPARRPNPDVVLAGTPFVFQAALAPWTPMRIGGEDQKLRATVSSFGAGGSNVHVILEEAPPVAAPPEAAPGPRAFVFSARDPERLGELIARMAAFVRAEPDLSLARMAHTLRTGRERMAAAAEIRAATQAELLAALEAWPEPVAIAPHLGVAAIEDLAGPPLVLPGYPFARERHWLAPAGAAGPAIPAQPLARPVPRALTAEAARAFIAGILAEETGLAVSALPGGTAFRNLGATSMFALRLLRAFADELGVELTHRELEAHPTLDALAVVLAGLPPEPPPAAAQTGDGAQAPTADDRLPLSEGQKGLWALQKLYPAMAAYNVPLVFRVEGICVPALERACRALLERFPILAGTIVDGEPEPARAATSTDVPLTVLDLPADADEIAFARSRATRPFDLAAAAPIRFELMRRPPVAEGAGLVLILGHHIVFDGVSAALVARVFWDAYDHFASGATPPPPAPHTDFYEFVAWERAHLAGPRGAAQLTYWTERLGGTLPVLDLPTDRAPGPDNAFAGESRERVLTPELTRAARTAAGALGINPSAFFLGVLALLLHRLTGQEDIVVGMPTMGRPARRFENSVGYFANMIALPLKVTGGMPAAQVLRAAQGEVTGGLDHADYPFALLLRRLGRTGAGAPLYPVTFAYQNFLDDRMLGPLVMKSGARISHVPAIRQEGDGAFGLEMFEEGERLRLVASYDPGRFDPATVDALMGHFVTLVGSVCAHPQAPVAEQALMDAATRRRILDVWGQGPAAPARPGSVLDWVRGQAARTPDATAIVCDDTRLTYRRLAKRASRLAVHLRAQGVRPGTRVAVMLERGPRAIVALLGVWGAGAVWVPLDAAHPDARLADILGDADVGAVITQATHERRLVPLVPRGARVVQMDRARAAIRKCPADTPPVRVPPQNPAYIIHTSGSTGRPKGVVVSHEALAGHCLAIIAGFGLSERDRVLQFASHSVDTALEQILPPLVCGARLVMRGPEIWSPSACRDLLRRAGVTVADLPPGYLAELLHAVAHAPEGIAKAPLRLLVAGGERLPPETVRLWAAGPLARTRLLNAYGPTEATITATLHDVRPEDAQGPVPIGLSLPGVVVRILDAAGQPVPEGVPGELHVGGARLALGYHQRDDLTFERFIPDPFSPPERGWRLYRTGDRAVFLRGRNGAIGFLGRVDDQVKVRGHRIEPGEVEAALRACGCRDAAVVARSDAQGDSLLLAFVAAPAEDFDEAALRARLAQRLPASMLPQQVVRLDALPATPGGKVDRTALRARASLDARPEAQGPRDVVEAQLLRIWQDLLGADGGAIGVQDDFFARGGHSLLAVRLLGAIERTFSRALTMADLIAAPTLAAQAEMLRKDAPDKNGPQGEGIPAAPRGAGPVLLRAGAGAPLFLVHAVGGSVSCYLALARALDTARPVYGLQSPDLDAAQVSAAAGDLRTLAAHHLRGVQAVQPAGPWHLAGWSLGGTIAYEMARQMHAAGGRAASLTLIDSYAPDLLRALEVDADRAGAGPQGLLAAFARDMLGAGSAPPLRANGAPVQRLADLVQVPQVHAALRGVPPRRVEALFRLFEAHALAARAYRPKRYEGPATVLAATDGGHPDGARGWSELVRGRLSLHRVPGDHYGLMAPPHVTYLARHLAAAVERPISA